MYISSNFVFVFSSPPPLFGYRIPPGKLGRRGVGTQVPACASWVCLPVFHTLVHIYEYMYVYIYIYVYMYTSPFFIIYYLYLYIFSNFVFLFSFPPPLFGFRIPPGRFGRRRVGTQVPACASWVCLPVFHSLVYTYEYIYICIYVYIL